jgi:PAS domain S-box-containing protein
VHDLGSNPAVSANDDSLSVDIQRMSLESAIRQAAEAIVITSATGKILYVNPAFTQMTGYVPEEVVGHYPSILKSGTQDPAYYEQLWKTILSGRIWRGELINRRKDGTLYTEEMSITPVRNSGGRTTNYIAIKQDVTASRAAEAARQFLAAIVASTDDAVVGSSLDGKIITWNRGAEKLYGYQAAEVVGQSILMLMASEYHQKCQRIAEGLARGRTFPRFLSIAIRKNGERVEVSVSVSLVKDRSGRPTGLAAIIRDVSISRRTLRNLRANETRLRSAFERAPIGQCICAAGSRILQGNEVFRRMLGFAAAELPAPGWEEIIHPEYLEGLMQIFERMLEDRQPVAGLEMRFVPKNGPPILARLRISLIDIEGSYEFLVQVQEFTAAPLQLTPPSP